MPSVVIDVGSDRFEIGFAADGKPRHIFPCIVGRSADGQIYVGDEAEGNSDVKTISKPVSFGVIADWDGLALLVNHGFKKLGVSPSDCSVVTTEPPLQTNTQKEHLTSIMFDKVGVDRLYIAVSAILALYNSQRTTGIVLDIGEGASYVVPAYQGYPLPQAVMKLDLAQGDIEHYFAKLMAERGVDLHSNEDLRELSKIVREVGYVALDFEQEMDTAASSTSLNRTYTMPDGRVIEIGNERFRATEAFFRPDHMGAQDNIALAIHNSIVICDVDLRKDLYANVILAGVGSALPGMVARIEKELALLAPGSMQINVIAPEGSDSSIWGGGAALANIMENMPQMWITTMEYKAFGPAIVHRKCASV